MDEFSVVERIEADPVRVELAGTEIGRVVTGQDVGGFVERRLFGEDPRLGVFVVRAGPETAEDRLVGPEFVR